MTVSGSWAVGCSHYAIFANIEARGWRWTCCQTHAHRCNTLQFEDGEQRVVPWGSLEAEAEKTRYMIIHWLATTKMTVLTGRKFSKSPAVLFLGRTPIICQQNGSPYDSQ